jgi:hypothetical protein
MDELQVLLKAKRQKFYEDQGQFPSTSLNAFFLRHIQYQGMVIWVQKFYNEPIVCPYKTSLKGTVYGEITPG